MIFTRTPFRMSFFGGGTDIPEFFREHGGAVISTTFDKYVYVNVRHLPRFFEHRNQVTYSRIERVGSVEEIEHPAVRNAMQMLDMRDLIVNYDADLPARTGLGSSSSFAVGMLNAFYALKGKYVGKRQLAEDAIHLERVLCNEAGGWQDQIAASYGGFNRIDFNSEGYVLRPIVIHPDRKKQLNENLMMFFTGFSRFSSEIQSDTKKMITDKTRQLLEMKELVDIAEGILEDKHGDLDEFGRLLDHTWRLKRQTGSKISTGSIDEMYSKALEAGALGGKLLGAGGGGFLLFYVDKEKQGTVKAALDKLLYVPFSFENAGTQIIHYTPEQYDITD